MGPGSAEQDTRALEDDRLRRSSLVDDLRDLTARAYREGDTALAADLRTAARALATPRDRDEAAALGGADLVTYKLSQDLDDLRRAVVSLRQAHELLPTPAGANNLASALLEFMDRAPEAVAERDQIFVEALSLLRWALPSDVTEPKWVTRSTTLLGAYMDGVVFGLADITVDDMLAHVDHLLGGLDRLHREDAEAFNLAGSAMLLAADRGHAGGDLNKGVDLLARAVALTPEEHLDFAARVGNLASICMDRFERQGDRNDVDRAVTHAESALVALAEDDIRRPMVVNTLTNALVSRWQFYNHDADLERALSFLSELADFGTADDVHFGALRENAALLAFHGARTYSSPHLLLVSIRLFHEAIGDGDLTSQVIASRVGALAAALAEKYRQSRDDADLEEAIGAASTAAMSATAVGHEWAVHATTLGNLLHDSFLRYGDVSTLDDAAQLHTEALSRLAERAPGTPVYLNNIAIVLNERFERFGEVDDLRRAVEAIERSLALSVASSRDHAGRCNNAGHMLVALYNITGTTAHLTRARDLAHQGAAIARARGTRSTEIACLGTLSDVLQAIVGSDLGEQATARRPATSPAQALVELTDLWARRGDDLLSGTGGTRAARLIRYARLPVAVAVAGQDVDAALEEAALLAEGRRPALALAASRELLALRLAALAQDLVAPARTPSTGSAKSAADVALRSIRALVNQNEQWRESLTWLRDARGVGAMAAQERLIDHDALGALSAFEQGHALLLGQVATDRHRLRLRASDGAQAPVVDLSSTSAGLGLALTIWSTPSGGGIVVSNDGRPVRYVLLPQLTSSLAASLRARIAAGPYGGPAQIDLVVTEVAATLSGLLAPIEDLLVDIPCMTICAGGPLGSLPWHAVRLSSGQFLDDLCILYSAPTLAVAGDCLAATSTCEGAEDCESWSLSSPTTARYRALAHAADEGACFASGERLVLGSDATTDAAGEAQILARVLHFACHAALGATDPLANHLLLAGDRPWYASDVIAVGRGPRLVVLSACETGAVQGAHADEGLGLASAFLAAGTPGVIASLWSVGDASAANFMTTAAPALLDSGADPARALRDARAHQRRLGAPPSSWAAFTFVGR